MIKPLGTNPQELEFFNPPYSPGQGRKDRWKWFCNSQIFDERITKGREIASRRKDRNERQKQSQLESRYYYDDDDEDERMLQYARQQEEYEEARRQKYEDEDW